MSPGKTLVIVTSIEDARDLITNGDRESTVVSIHSAATEYLSNRGREVRDAGEWLKDSEIREIYIESDATVDRMLRRLDGAVGPKINEVLGFEAPRLFASTYRYAVKQDYFGFLLLRRSIQRLLAETRHDNVVLYNSVALSQIDGMNFIQDALAIAMKERNTSFESRKLAPDPNKQPEATRASRFKKVAASLLAPGKAITRIRYALLKRKPVAPRLGQTLVLAFEPLYELIPIPAKLEAKTIFFSANSAVPINLSAEPVVVDEEKLLKAIYSADEVTASEEPVMALLAGLIVREVAERCGEYFRALVLVRELAEKCRIAALWGNPGAPGPARYAIQGLLGRVGVFGMQHGASYGVQDNLSAHFDTDYSHATHYFTFGFDHRDIDIMHPALRAKCEFVPVGSPRAEEPRPPLRRIVDIVFPIANSVPLTMNSLRIKNDTLARNQSVILQAMDGLNLPNMIVKPPPFASPRFFAHCEALANLRRARVDREITFSSWLLFNRPRAVVIEYPSTPLYEVMEEDCEIFALADPVLPFHAEALELLKRRVHYFEGVEELCDALEKWSRGELARKRDDGFWNRYVHRANSESAIVRRIEGELAKLSS